MMGEEDSAPKLKCAPVSVIIPCFRCAETIQRAVESVIAQTLPPEEIILIDDFSNDDMKTVSALYALFRQHPDSHIVILRLEVNQGPGGARNEGWSRSSQPYIAFLDADDSWHPKKLEIQLQWMLKNSDVVLSGHQSNKLEEFRVLPALPRELKSTRVNKLGLLLTNCFPTRSVMIKRDVIERFVTDKRYAEDYLLWLSIVLAGHPSWVLEMPLAYTYKDEFGEGGLTGNLLKMQQGVIDAFIRLCKMGLISTFTLVLISMFSWLKFLRRWGIVQWRFCLSKEN
jgi:glycosyltransferase involved in cell wall biosynthesis